jgi:hypothetical protein
MALRIFIDATPDGTSSEHSLIAQMVGTQSDAYLPHVQSAVIAD